MTKNLTQCSEADRTQASADVGGVHQRQDGVYQQRHERRQSQAADLPAGVVCCVANVKVKAEAGRKAHVVIGIVHHRRRRRCR